MALRKILATKTDNPHLNIITLLNNALDSNLIIGKNRAAAYATKAMCVWKASEMRPSSSDQPFYKTGEHATVRESLQRAIMSDPNNRLYQDLLCELAAREVTDLNDTEYNFSQILGNPEKVGQLRQALNPYFGNVIDIFNNANKLTGTYDSYAKSEAGIINKALISNPSSSFSSQFFLKDDQKGFLTQYDTDLKKPIWRIWKLLTKPGFLAEQAQTTAPSPKATASSK